MAAQDDRSAPDVAALIREEMARRRISRQYLADMARISLSTLEKALAGHRPFTLATVIRLEEAMGVSLRAPQAAAPAPAGDRHAAPELGGYSRASVSWLEGDYLTLRPSFGEAKAIFAYCTEIGWDAGAAQLKFRERERIDASFSQEGGVSAPHLSGHIYLVTNTGGQYRLAILSRPSISGEMFGLLTTLRAGQGAHLAPVSTPLALVPLKNVERPAFGRIHAGEPCFDAYAATLRRALADGYADFARGE